MNPTSTLVRTFGRVDPEGRLLLPPNIRRALQVKKNQLVELKIIGTSRNRHLLISCKAGK